MSTAKQAPTVFYDEDSEQTDDVDGSEDDSEDILSAFKLQTLSSDSDSDLDLSDLELSSDDDTGPPVPIPAPVTTRVTPTVPVTTRGTYPPVPAATRAVPTAPVTTRVTPTVPVATRGTYPPVPVATRVVPPATYPTIPAVNPSPVKIQAKNLPPARAKPTFNIVPKPAPPLAKTVDIEAVIEKMQGLTIAGVSSSPAPMTSDIETLVIKEQDETPADFEARKNLAIRLASIADYKISNSTAVTLSSMMMRKAKLGVTYDQDVESAISYAMSLLQR